MNLSDAELRLRCVELVINNADKLNLNTSVVGSADEMYSYITNGLPKSKSNADEAE